MTGERKPTTLPRGPDMAGVGWLGDSVIHQIFMPSFADSDGDGIGDLNGFVPSPGNRPGYYLKNFFDEQPALNFGYARADDAEPWRQPADAPGPQANG